ncbi:hypothetical protein DV735_g5807, partial [Chaetothyriales sp. CBS 134920]
MQVVVVAGTSLPFHLLLPLLPFLLSLFAVSATATGTASFCKCICFNNSTIIALNPPRSSSAPTSPSVRSLLNVADPRAASDHHLTCSDCNRAFCLSYNLPICKEATENDVFTTCFQRDSLKDEMVVVLFLVATAGLLGWALVRPWIDWFKERRRPQYLPLGLRDDPPAGDHVTGNNGERNGI